MKKLRPNYKLVEWSSPNDLHRETLLWISELQFIKDEISFLNSLVENYTLKLISGEVYKKSFQVISELSKESAQLKEILKRVRVHNNELEILVDGKDEIEKEKEFKESHYQLKIEMLNYLENFRKTKKEIFLLIKRIMKKQKQKRLLN
ncbi:MAG: hypothetical protein HKN48_11000 [Flavobacteriaceae bacterium]|nr:hypothetical protein [Flavobacteriaceae bacterium]